ncbi:MAG: DUF4825 domain-containing protein [Lachnospiraceae bacterium]|nr:DUF4825 domain-containing protein [Lachnospiraceae bacterium]
MREILITATVLILCVLLIRRIFRGKISSRLQYALWFLVALRLVIPVSAQFDLGPFSRFRLLDLMERDESGIAERLNETIRLEEPIQMTVDSGSILFRLFTTDEIRETIEDMSKDGPTSVFMAGTLGFSRLDVLWFLWGLGALIVGVWILAANIVFSRRLRRNRQSFALPENVKEAVLRVKKFSAGKDMTAADTQGEEGSDREEKQGRLFGKKSRLPAFWLAEGISSPCLYGFPGREAVYLTADVVDDEDRLRHVIVHELVHKKQGDSFWALLRSVLVTVYWFHPLVWIAAVCSKRDCELACDEGALALLGEDERIPYGETLLSIITKKGRASDLVCTATTMTGSGKSVKERIRFIAKEPKVFYAAIAGALFLIAAVCLFVFTRDARFHGTTVDEQEGLMVTGADMQIPLPASIGGISGCVVEKGSDDVVIYHIGAQEEVGRFSRMPLKDALELVDEGREVWPIGEYGYNYLLRAYLGEPLSRTEHYYFPAEAGDAGHGDATEYVPGTDENPMLSKDWEVIPLEDENPYAEQGNRSAGILSHEDIYLPAEEIIISDAPIDKSTKHTFTQNQDMADEAEAAGGAETGVPGTDSNTASGTDSIDDTTYIIDDDSAQTGDEGKVDYLPNETITTTTYEPTEVNVDEMISGCYVYVKADFYGKVKDKYQEEMAFIDTELKAAANQVIILSLNRERREALFDALTANRTPYVGDNIKVGALTDALPLPPTLSWSGGFSLQTLERPYSLRFDYESSTDYFTKEDQDMLYFNAAMLFYAIGNVEAVSMEVKHPSNEGSVMVTYYREELEKELPGLQNADYEDDQVFRDGLSELHTAVETYLSAAK